MVDGARLSNGKFFPIKQTNADKIRQMSDIQLAKWVCAVHGSCVKFCPMAKDCDGIDCDGAWLDWLKQEVCDDKC